jgi:hypothetical protein
MSHENVELVDLSQGDLATRRASASAPGGAGGRAHASADHRGSHRALCGDRRPAGCRVRGLRGRDRPLIQTTTSPSGVRPEPAALALGSACEHLRWVPRPFASDEARERRSARGLASALQGRSERPERAAALGGCHLESLGVDHRQARSSGKPESRQARDGLPRALAGRAGPDPLTAIGDLRLSG